MTSTVAVLSLDKGKVVSPILTCGSKLTVWRSRGTVPLMLRELVKGCPSKWAFMPYLSKQAGESVWFQRGPFVSWRVQITAEVIAIQVADYTDAAQLYLTELKWCQQVMAALATHGHQAVLEAFNDRT